MGFLDTLSSIGKDVVVNTYESLQENQERFQKGYDNAYDKYLDYSDDQLKREFLKIRRDISGYEKKGRLKACRDILIDRNIINPNN